MKSTFNATRLIASSPEKLFGKLNRPHPAGEGDPGRPTDTPWLIRWMDVYSVNREILVDDVPREFSWRTRDRFFHRTDTYTIRMTPESDGQNTRGHRGFSDDHAAHGRKHAL